MGNEITSFQEKIHIILGYYVYKLIDPRNGQVFYVGRGNGNRIFDHVSGTVSKLAQIYKELGKEDGYEIENSEEAENIFSLKEKTINEIHISNLEVLHVIHRHGLTLDQAKEVEAALIDDYPGASNVQGGYGSFERGPMNVKEIVDKFSRESVNPTEKIENVFIFPIPNSLNDGQSIYDATRRIWKVIQSNQNFKKPYAVGLRNSISEGSYEIAKWVNVVNSTKQEFESHNHPNPNVYQPLHNKNWSNIISKSGYWNYGNYLIVEFDGNGKFRFVRGSQDKKTWYDCV